MRISVRGGLGLSLQWKIYLGYHSQLLFFSTVWFSVIESSEGGGWSVVDLTVTIVLIVCRFG